MLEVQLHRVSVKFAVNFYAPEGNVATVKLGASVIECHCGRDEMIGGKSADIPVVQGKGWTWHEIGKGSIIVQLSQPYALNFIRMMLPPRFERRKGKLVTREFSYFVEISLDKENWTRIADHTAERRCHRQEIKFLTQPVIFIKIVGTSSYSDYEVGSQLLFQSIL